MQKLFFLAALSSTTVLAAVCSNGRCYQSQNYAPSYQGSYSGSPYYDGGYQGSYSGSPSYDSGYQGGYRVDSPYQGQGYPVSQPTYQSQPYSTFQGQPMDHPVDHPMDHPVGAPNFNSQRSYQSQSYQSQPQSYPSQQQTYQNQPQTYTKQQQTYQNQPQSYQIQQQQNRNSGYGQQSNDSQQYGRQSNTDQNRVYYKDNTNYNQRSNSQDINDDQDDDQADVTDQDIRNQINDTLSSGWFSKGFDGVKFEVNNGNVLLRGTVDTIDNKNKIEQSVRKIDGVRQVNNQIVTTKGMVSNSTYSEPNLQNSEAKFPQDKAATDQDRVINAKIREKLNGGWLSKGFDALVIRTANGIVVITGSVDTPADVQKVNEHVRSVEGVKSVNNQVNVKGK